MFTPAFKLLALLLEKLRIDSIKGPSPLSPLLICHVFSMMFWGVYKYHSYQTSDFHINYWRSYKLWAYWMVLAPLPSFWIYNIYLNSCFCGHTSIIHIKFMPSLAQLSRNLNFGKFKTLERQLGANVHPPLAPPLPSTSPHYTSPPVLLHLN